MTKSEKFLLGMVYVFLLGMLAIMWYAADRQETLSDECRSRGWHGASGGVCFRTIYEQ